MNDNRPVVKVNGVWDTCDWFLLIMIVAQLYYIRGSAERMAVSLEKIEAKMTKPAPELIAVSPDDTHYQVSEFVLNGTTCTLPCSYGDTSYPMCTEAVITK